MDGCYEYSLLIHQLTFLVELVCTEIILYQLKQILIIICNCFILSLSFLKKNKVCHMVKDINPKLVVLMVS